MHPFFKELQNARLARGISLEQIEEKTRISIQFLTALEEGNISVLPSPYVRAFLREYAEAAGLDANDTLKRFREATGTPETPPPEASTLDEHAPVGAGPSDERSPESPGIPPWIKMAVGAGALLALLFLVWFLMPSSDRNSVREIPFERAVKEAERRAPSQETPPVETRATAPPARGDSLTLIARTTDIVWVNIAIDDQAGADLMLQANQQVTWKARDRFKVSVGNAGGIRFKLENKDLEPVGKPGEVVRDITIRRTGILAP